MTSAFWFFFETRFSLRICLQLHVLAFQKMESPDQVVDGPIYVLKIKRTKDFNSKELLYALVHKGQANLGLLNLKNIVIFLFWFCFSKSYLCGMHIVRALGVPVARSTNGV